MYTYKYPKLMEPLHIGPLIAKNRIMSAPASQAEIDNLGFHTDRNVAFYKRRAQGGAGIVTVGDCIVHPTGIDHPKQVKMWEGGGQLALPSLTHMAYAIKQHGALANIQLSHGGELCEPDFVPDGKPYGPRHFIDEYGDEIFYMEKDMIHEIVEAFGDAAALAQYAGFDMCQIHAGHHWLLGQFLSPESNQRDDEYGGSLENRARFLMEVIENVRAKCGPRFPIEVRISSTEFIEGGITLEDSCALAEMLDGKIEILHCSVGHAGHTELSRLGHPSIFVPHGCNVKYAAEIRKHVSKTLIACVGGISVPDEMEEMVETGQTDIVAIGRALIADPDIPNKIRDNKEEEIRPCLRCSECLASMTDQHYLKCSVNPVMGREWENENQVLPAQPQKVMIAGGGPGGMEAAITAVKRGHQVSLYEAKDHLGGALTFAEHESFKGDLWRYCQWMVKQTEKSGAQIHLNTTVTKELVEEVNPDVLLIAVGADPAAPPIPGLDGENVIFATHLYDEPLKEVGQRVVILGGGLVGCEMGVDLAGKGHEVHIVEMQEEVAPECNHYHRIALMNELEVKQVQLHVNVRASLIDKTGVTGIDENGEDVFLPADTVIVSLGLKSRRDKVDELLSAGVREIRLIGDCISPKQVLQATHTAYNAVMDIGVHPL